MVSRGFNREMFRHTTHEMDSLSNGRPVNIDWLTSCYAKWRTCDTMSASIGGKRREEIQAEAINGMMWFTSKSNTWSVDL